MCAAIYLSAQSWGLDDGSYIRGEKRPWFLSFEPFLIHKLMDHVWQPCFRRLLVGGRGKKTKKQILFMCRIFLYCFHDFMIFIYFSFSCFSSKRMLTLLFFFWGIPFKVFCLPFQWQPHGLLFLAHSSCWSVNWQSLYKLKWSEKKIWLFDIYFSFWT